MPIRNPILLAAIGIMSFLCLFALAVWKMELKITEALLIVIAVLLLCHVVVLLIKNQSPNGATFFEKLVSPFGGRSAGLSPERFKRMLAINDKFTDAIQVLKSSRLVKGKHRSRALYSLPWYMIIGAAGSGKSTALRYSHLHFPSVNPKSPDQKLQGIGGTRNCDFWFSPAAVLLDTAGRYMTPIAESEDREEWITFLHILKKRRKRKPSIHGVIVAISLIEEKADSFSLLSASEEEIERQAKYMRHCLDEIMKMLKTRFPIYLVFTKCDLLHGFHEFFEELGPGGREQILGCTFTEDFRSQQPQSAFSREFARLCHSLERWRLLRLRPDNDAIIKRKIYNFPLELSAARDKLAQFVAAFMAPDPFQENPIFRGFYFISGTQAGVPLDRVTNSVVKEFGLAPNAPEVEPQPELERPDSFFIKNLFTQVIIPDQSLAERQRRRWTISDLAVALLAIVILGISVSYFGNRRFLKTVERVTQIDVTRLDRAPENLVALEKLRHQLVKFEEGPPFYLRWVSYDREAVAQQAGILYCKLSSQIFLNLVAQELERSLAVSPAMPSVRAIELKTYAMLANSIDMDRTFLSQQLKRIFRHWVEASRISHSEELVAFQVAHYKKHLREGNAPRLLKPNDHYIREWSLLLKEVTTTSKLAPETGENKRDALNARVSLRTEKPILK
jgi:type VI secretion system protein ImpL